MYLDLECRPHPWPCRPTGWACHWSRRQCHAMPGWQAGRVTDHVGTTIMGMRGRLAGWACHKQHRSCHVGPGVITHQVRSDLFWNFLIDNYLFICLVSRFSNMNKQKAKRKQQHLFVYQFNPSWFLISSGRLKNIGGRLGNIGDDTENKIFPEVFIDTHLLVIWVR